LALVATAQQAAIVRRVAVVMFYREDDHEGQLRAWALEDGLRAKGWSVDTNLTFDVRWGTGEDAWIRSTVKELLVFSPSVVVANSDPVARAVQSASKTVPVVFIGSSEPVAQGFVQSFAHPGGNLTGFTVLEPSIGPKWLQLLKEIAPQAQRVSVLLNSANAGSKHLLRSCIEEGSKFEVEVIAAEIGEPSDIELSSNSCSVPKLRRRLGISNSTFGWSWIPLRNPSEHQADVVATICLDC
jgi:putative ABC transport system substrate-binding protein